jgi:hypothetical protein
VISISYYNVLTFRLSAVKLASINIACMTVDNAAAGRNNSVVEGEDGRKVAVSGSVSSSDAGAEAKAALHAVMLHFLTSSSL